MTSSSCSNRANSSLPCFADFDDHHHWSSICWTSTTLDSRQSLMSGCIRGRSLDSEKRLRIA